MSPPPTHICVAEIHAPKHGLMLLQQLPLLRGPELVLIETGVAAVAGLLGLIGLEWLLPTLPLPVQRSNTHCSKALSLSTAASLVQSLHHCQQQ